jgi:hypothetical protein
VQKMMCKTDPGMMTDRRQLTFPIVLPHRRMLPRCGGVFTGHSRQHTSEEVAVKRIGARTPLP